MHSLRAMLDMRLPHSVLYAAIDWLLVGREYKPGLGADSSMAQLKLCCNMLDENVPLVDYEALKICRLDWVERDRL